MLRPTRAVEFVVQPRIDLVGWGASWSDSQGRSMLEEASRRDSVVNGLVGVGWMNRLRAAMQEERVNMVQGIASAHSSPPFSERSLSIGVYAVRTLSLYSLLCALRTNCYETRDGIAVEATARLTVDSAGERKPVNRTRAAHHTGAHACAFVADGRWRRLALRVRNSCIALASSPKHPRPHPVATA